MKVPPGMKAIVNKKKYYSGDEIPDNILPEKMKKKFESVSKQQTKPTEEKKADKK